MNTAPTTITRHPAPFAAVAAAVVAFAIGSVAVPTTSSAAPSRCGTGQSDVAVVPHVATRPPDGERFTGGQVMIGQ
ncbi:MAG: hypothetical protein WAV00_10355 [Nocardioides sp.]